MHRAAPLAMAALVSFGAVAQDLEAARALAKKGSALYDLGKYGEALDAFESAYEKKPVPGLLFNIAQCHRQMGQLEQAARVYRSYLRTDPPEAAARQARELLAKVEEALKQQSTAVQSPPHELTSAPPVAVSAWQPPPAPPPPAPPGRVRWPAYSAGGVAAGAAALGVVWALGSRSESHARAIGPFRDSQLGCGLRSIPVARAR